MNPDLFSNLNWLAVLVGSLGYFILGAVWYSALFRNQWMKAVGITMDGNSSKGLGGILVASFVTVLICSIGLALLIAKIGSSGWMTGAKIGLIAGVCFSAATIANSYFYEKRPVSLMLINGFYNIFGCMISGIIIAVWK
ncbi:MAG TPA: DUF1761 domain-containing protein [Chitinophagaceae bacterium]